MPFKVQETAQGYYTIEREGGNPLPAYFASRAAAERMAKGLTATARRLGRPKGVGTGDVTGAYSIDDAKSRGA